MKILVVDDEKYVLEDSMEVISELLPDATIISATSIDEAIAIVENHIFDIAFLDIEMPGLSGIDLARCIQKKNPKTNIIFVTAFKQYGFEAASDIMCSGYILKPLSKPSLSKVLDNLRYSSNAASEDKITAVCFGRFEVSYKGNMLHFSRSVGKELLALLISEKGCALSKNEILEIIWPEDSMRDVRSSYFAVAVSSLRASLEEIGKSDAFEHNRNSYRIRPEYFNCDYYDYLKSDKKTGIYDFMTQYSWGNFYVDF